MSLSDKILQFVRRWWPTSLCVIVILYATLSSDPTPDIEMSAIPHIDKLIHAIMFGGLTGAIVFDYQRTNRHPHISRRVMAIIAVVCTVAGGLDEIAQATLTTNRDAEWADFAADITGIVIACFTAPVAVRKILKIRS